jgi:CDP-glucose 4,6-dehydratase
MGTVNILDAALKTEAVQAVIIVTSDKCYKNNEWIWGYRENDPMGGKDPYSASKGSAELITNAYLQSYFNGDYSSKLLASVRAGNVIGGGDWADYRLIPDLIRSAVGGESIDIRSPGATRPWQHVIEALSGYLFLGEKLLKGDRSFNGAWNFGPHNNMMVTVDEIINKSKLIWNEIKFNITGKTEHHEANYLKLDIAKALELLAWKPIWNLEETLRYTIQWYKDFYNGQSNSTHILSSNNITKYVEDFNKTTKI